MKKVYNLSSFILFLLFFCGSINAQQGCSLSSTNNLYGYGCGYGDEIQDFEIDGIANNGTGCSSNGYYTYYTAPSWTLQIGQTYTWSATTGSPWLDQGLAVWIDLNNDGYFSSVEQLVNSSPAINHSGSITIPYLANAGAGHRMRVRCDYWTYISNTNNTACEGNGPPNYNWYYGETEDYDVYLLPPSTPCSGTPLSNSVVTPTAAICPNTGAYLALATTYTVSGLTYQWQASTQSSMGVWNNVGTSGMTYYNPALSGSTWHQVVITCTNSNQSVTAMVGLVEVQDATIDSVPYFEGFEGIIEENQLPNCSWMATNLGSEAFTYTSSSTWDNRIPRNGNNFASFYYWPGGTNTFYSNGIYLNAGVTYSASMWYTTNMYGDDNWEDLSMLIGPNQNNTGQDVIATTGGPAIAAQYKSLSNTFTVASTGVYYVAIEATANTNAYSYYLTWDDLEITAPCSINAPVMNLSSNQYTICAGDPITLSASGADSYSWDTGENTGIISPNLQGSHLFVVTGTSTLTGCSGQQSAFITVNPKPFVAVVADKPKVCSGEPVNLSVVGNAQNYNWSGTGGIGNFQTVTPAVTTVYSVQGTNSFGCQSSAGITISVTPSPVLTADASETTICHGDYVVLTGTGAVTYQWLSNTGFVQSNPAIVQPAASVQYTMIGTDVNGCKGTAYVSVEVAGCSGLGETGKLSGIRVFPNPGAGVYTLRLPNNAASTLEVADIVGRVVYTNSNITNLQSVDISTLANGVYYFRVRSADNTEVIRVLKN
jgi:hypothetical protein